VNLQKRIVAKIKEVATDPYATHSNVTKLQGRDGYRLRVGDFVLGTNAQPSKSFSEVAEIVFKEPPLFSCLWH